ncbi:MAG: hypothetical protein LC715_01980 [Gammaproteobacteria bacterium]|nr:hypothetical protein [Gammaproteobacteria bacterium]
MHPGMPAATGTSWRDARQLVLVTVPSWDADHGMLRAYERDDGGRWRPVGQPSPVVIGRAGTAWGLGLHPAQAGGPVKREGDGRAPAGVFAIGQAFGYAPGVSTTLPYTAMQASHYCIDVVGSPLYDQIVDARMVGADAIAGSTEPMRRDLHADGDQRYKLGFVIEHNPRNTQGAGSCIFAHVWKSPTTATAGCTAMDENTMQALLSWLRPDRRPVFVLLPASERARLQRDWQLPPLQPQP